MKFLDWIQIASVALVLASLAVGLSQLREIAAQSRAMGASLHQLAYGGVSNLATDPRLMLLPDDPELLSWFLRSKGFKATTPTENKRRLYVMAKLIQHETNFLNHCSGHLSDESWIAWKNVLQADLKIPVFQEVWRSSREVYAGSFAALVDALLDLDARN